ITLVGLLLSFGAEVVDKIIVPDDLEKIAQTLEKMADRNDVNLIITTGGTGLSPRDNTPEATLKVIEKLVPGIAEAIRLQTMKKTPTAILSRGVCGIRNNTLIINLPGSPNAVVECFEVIEPILKHAVSLIEGKKVHCAN
ncbi:MAG: molybdenum cofactor biosynthesis protein B, partial [Pyrinomonadaceae bacterium]